MATRVHASAFVGPGVELDEDVVVGPGAVLLGPLRLHRGVRVMPGALLGGPPELTSEAQSAAWDGHLDHAGVEVGPRTVVRELAVVHQGSHRPTRIGADCWLLNRCYVAHDCQVGDGVTLSAGVSLGGHVVVGDRSNLGMGAVVHQRRSIGEGAMVGMASAVTRDVPPFALVHGVPGRLHGVNAVGLRRRGAAEQDVRDLGAVYAAPAAVDRTHLPEALRGAWDAWAATSPAKPLVALG